MIKTIKSEYHRFICRSRMIILLAFAILVWQVVGSSLCNHAKMMEAGLQLFEPYIATANSYLVLLIVPIFALILMSDFPNLEDGYMFTIYRMGKTKWLIGKVIFALLCSFTIMAIVFVLSTIPCAGKISSGTKWSPATTKLAYYYPELTYNTVFNLIQRDIYNHIYPGIAAIHSILLTTLLIFGYSLMLLIGKIFNKKNLFMGIDVVLMAAGGILATIKHKAAFFFPAGNASLAGRYTEIGRTSNMPFYLSYIYMSVWIVLMLIVAFVGIKRRNICTK